MKKIILMAACLVTLTTQAFTTLVPTIPLVLRPTSTLAPGGFVLLLIAQGMQIMSEAACEPLGNYEVGIQHSVGYTSTTTSWPSWVYETRMIDGERSYDKDPATGRSWWWFKTVWTTVHRDGSESTEITYSQTPPLDPDFEQMSVSYVRFPATPSDSQFQFSAQESNTGYLKRLGNAAWGLPVMAIFSGWNWNPLWRNDYLYHTPTTPWETRRYIFLGPSSSGAGSYTIFSLAVGVPNAEVDQIGAATYYWNPQG